MPFFHAVMMLRTEAVYSMAHASKAVVPADAGGPFAQNIGSSVSGDMAWGLVVSAFVTNRVSPTDPPRYSLVVLNQYVASVT